MIFSYEWRNKRSDIKNRVVTAKSKRVLRFASHDLRFAGSGFMLIPLLALLLSR